jgi:hypothetical protein
LGDYSIDVIKDAADEVLAVLKDESLNDSARKMHCEEILDTMKEETFNELTVLA